MTCPACRNPLKSLAELYAAEVEKVDADPERLGRLRPPTSRTAIHGFLLAVMVWMSGLVPFFAHGQFWRTCLPVWILTAVWIEVFRRARAKDGRLRGEYDRRRGCGACGFIL